MEIVGRSLSDVWNDAARTILEHGSEVKPRGLACRELTGVTLVMSEPRQRVPLLPNRRWSLSYAAAELTWYLQGRDDLAFMTRYASSYKNYSDDGLTLHGAYGPRIFGTDPWCCEPERPSQWNLALGKLIEDPDTRQAVISIHTPFDPGTVTKDYPCTMSLQFIYRNGALELHTTMRSNDLWLGTLYDVFCFTVLQELMANLLGSAYEHEVKLGKYVHHVGSLHLYARNYEGTQEVLNAEPITPWRPPLQLTLSGITFESQLKLLEERCREDAVYARRTLEGFVRSPSSKLDLATLCGLAFAWRAVQADPSAPADYRGTMRGLLEPKLGDFMQHCFH